MKKKVVVAVIAATFLAMSVYVSAEAVSLDDITEEGTPDDMAEDVPSDDTEETVQEETAEDGIETEPERIEKVDYYDRLIEAETKKRDYEIYTNLLKAQLSEIEIAYLTELETESEEKYKIEKTKLRLGHSTELQVEEARNNREAVRLQIKTAKDRKRFYKECIVLNGGEYVEVDLLEQTEALKEDYISNFTKNSVQLMYYKLQLQEYKETLEKGRYGTEREELEKQIELCELQQKQYEIDLQIYVKNLLMKYASIERQVEEKENQIAVVEKKLENAALLLEEGKISEMQISEMKRELQGLQYEKATFVCEMKLIYYILENALENQEV